MSGFFAPHAVADEVVDAPLTFNIENESLAPVNSYSILLGSFNILHVTAFENSSKPLQIIFTPNENGSAMSHATTDGYVGIEIGVCEIIRFP